MLNSFVVKKYAALVLAGTVPALLLAVGSAFYGLIWGGITFLFIGLLLSVVLGVVLLKNPFSKMLEGKGILGLVIDSTGVIRPFIFGVKSPFMGGKVGKKDVVDVFDREAVHQMAVPRLAEKKAEVTEDGGITLHLGEKEYNQSRFAMFHYPVILYNMNIQATITKDWFSEFEKDSFAEHGLLYIQRKVEELTTHVRDFGRYVVEMTRPKTSIFGSRWFWIVIVIACVLLLLLFAPSIISTIGNIGSSSAVGNAGAALGGGAVQPR